MCNILGCQLSSFALLHMRRFTVRSGGILVPSISILDRFWPLTHWVLDLSSTVSSGAGVSNWGGYAVACGLYLLQLCPAHQRYLRRGLGLEQPAPQEQLNHWRSNLPSVHKVGLYSLTLGSQWCLSTTMSSPLHPPGGDLPLHPDEFRDQKW